ncbi:MAG: histone deacetylase, partial [Myxococcota bacterium]
MKVYADARMEGHDPGRHHPESPERLVAVTRLLARDSALAWCAPRPAARRWVEEVHTARHVDAVDAQRGRAGSFDADTVVSAGSVDAAYLAAGAAVQVAEAALAGEHALGLVRPPGHHAEAHTAMGFCLFNSIAVAAAYARTELDCRRVAIVDWDVHHGNGTQHIFEARDDVLVCNLHQYPFYPGTGDPEEVGVGRGEGFTVNVGFPGGCKDGDYATAFSDVVLPIIERFAPDLVLVSAGFDAHRADPLA